MFLRGIGAPELVIIFMFIGPVIAFVWFISHMNKKATKNSLRELKETVKCQSCNKDNPSDSDFCRHCGAGLQVVTTPG